MIQSKLSDIFLFLKRLWWLAIRPHCFPEFISQIKNKTMEKTLSSQTNSDASQQKALKWCEELCVDNKTAINKITNNITYQSFYEKFYSEFTEARQRFQNCPFPMGGGGDLEIIYQLTEYLLATRVIETGTAFGWSSLAFLLSLQKRNGLLISTDLPYFHKKNSEKYIGLAVPDKLKNNWRLLKYPDKVALPQAIKILPTIDICHYDSDKSYKGKMWAYPKLFLSLKKNGIFLSDDISDNLAFHNFCQIINQQPLIVKTASSFNSPQSKYLGILIKQ